MKHFNTIAIVGVGLIGGSVGLAVRQRGLADCVVGIGRRQSSLRIARQAGAVTTTTIDLAKGVADAELVIVCTPVGRIVEDVRTAAANAPPGALITDVGSTKAEIVAALDEGLPRNCRFLGGHPLAGGEKTGPSHARADLFDGRVVILTPTKNTRAEDFDTLEAFWNALGAVVVQMSPEEHDQALAITSHLPHAAAAVLVGLVPERLFRLSGAGLLDTTRIAASDPSLWTQIFLQNRANLSRAVEGFIQRLQELRTALDQADLSSIQRILEQGKKNRDALGT
jgi:prephenate dehydrogenase